MSCIHNTFEGTCNFFDADNVLTDDNLGCDSEGNCLVEDDEYPLDSCFYFESCEDEEY